MRMIQFIIITLLIGSCVSQKNNTKNSCKDLNKSYVSAFNSIVNHKQTRRLLDNSFGKKKYCFSASNELIEFSESILNDFPEVIAKQTGKSKEEVGAELKKLLAIKSKDTVKNSLLGLRNCKSSNMIIFFSNIKENVVYADVFGTNDFGKRHSDYPIDYFNLHLSYLIYFNSKGDVEYIFMNGIWYDI
jgi:hypothetical protein